jgi:hypothetical protein
MLAEQYAFFHLAQERLNRPMAQYIQEKNKLSKRLTTVTNSLQRQEVNNAPLRKSITDAVTKINNAKQSYEEQIIALSSTSDCNKLLAHYNKFVASIESMVKHPKDTNFYVQEFKEDDSLSKLSSEIQTRDKALTAVTAVSASLATLMVVSAIISMALFAPIGISIGFVLLTTAALSASISLCVFCEKSNKELALDSTIETETESVDALSDVTSEEKFTPVELKH